MIRRRLLVAFVDALGPEQLERFGSSLASLPHRRALDGILGYSSGALATVLTGAPGAVHGRMCLFSAAQGRSMLAPLAWLGLLPRVVHERAALRRRVARVLSRFAGLTGYVALHRVPPEAFRWLDLPERDDLFAAGRIGGASTFLAEAREAGLSVYASPWQLPESERWEHARATLAASPPDLAFLYAAELDGALHLEGSDGERSQAARARIARRLDEARALMSRGADVVTLVVGDHGMAKVSRTIDPRSLLRGWRGLRVFVDSTMLRFWGTRGELDRARTDLARAALPGRWLGLDDLAARAAPVAGAPYGEAMFLLDEGVIFAPSFVGGRCCGMHGYDTGSVSARAAVASDSPLPEDVRALVDFAPLVRRLLFPG